MSFAGAGLEQWMRALASASWQAGLLVTVLLAVTWLLRRSRPMVRHALWGVVLLRLCLPLGLTSPLGIAGLAGEFQGEPSVSEGQAPPGAPAPAGGAAVDKGASNPSNPRAAAPLTAWAWCGVAWLIGAVTLSAFVIHQWLRLRRMVRASEPGERPELTALLGELCGRFGIARPVRLGILPADADALGPCATGWRLPQILLPARLAETWELSKLEPILIHELAHIRRADVVINAVQVLVQIVYWFHPLVWLANARLRRERELICDDFAVRHSGSNARRYAATVLHALEEVRLAPGWSLAGVGMGESGLSQRLRRLLDRDYALPQPLSRHRLGALFLAGTLGVLIASDAAPKKTPQPIPPAPGELVTKEWRIPASLFPRFPAAVSGDREALQQWLISQGVIFQGPASAEYLVEGARDHRLRARNTQEQLARIEAILDLDHAPRDPVEKQTNDPVIPKLELREATPSEAFATISAATGLKIFYTPADAEKTRITLLLSDLPASEALTYVTSLASLKFSREADGIHISAK